MYPFTYIIAKEQMVNGYNYLGDCNPCSATLYRAFADLFFVVVYVESTASGYTLVNARVSVPGSWVADYWSKAVLAYKTVPDTNLSLSASDMPLIAAAVPEFMKTACVYLAACQVAHLSQFSAQATSLVEMNMLMLNRSDATVEMRLVGAAVELAGQHGRYQVHRFTLASLPLGFVSY
jgi:hypothetical protein